ncbi:GNAT family N-acetyltransferase [Antarcticirhabdus aurantiaca]|uniref:GNAT family N-acetyltransferase n=1 Tax=Antarcticirhabdus aurantiaca TaxID=2606717 RepID=A0ACD4NLV4_9HYPH|nr:GNAT family N-acetyltransferase [Antarcticirhabdus aurantiaca]WAJ27791.1 GNAT family N-acetyltransferase [Jeongeuplla avenae]
MKTIAAELRTAETSDAAALAETHEAAWVNAYAGLIPHRALRTMVGRRDEAWWRRAIARRAAILILDYAGEAVGYATVGRNRTPALPAEGEIFELYVRPEFQGIGFGRRLHSGAARLLAERGLKGRVVWALADNAPALRFYENAGGVDVAEGCETFEGRTLRKIAFLWP